MGLEGSQEALDGSGCVCIHCRNASEELEKVGGAALSSRSCMTDRVMISTGTQEIGGCPHPASGRNRQKMSPFLEKSGKKLTNSVWMGWVGGLWRGVKAVAIRPRPPLFPLSSPRFDQCVTPRGQPETTRRNTQQQLLFSRFFAPRPRRWEGAGDERARRI